MRQHLYERSRADMRRKACIALVTVGLCGIAACTGRWHAGSAGTSRCPPAVPDDDHEPLYAFGRSLLTDSAWAELRRDQGLRGVPSSVRWVTDDRACRRIYDGLAAATGRPVNRSEPIAAVHLGDFYLVRFGEWSTRWLLGPDFRMRNLFVVPD
jgi:hypothetical protein